jgi:hypothetical protein
MQLLLIQTVLDEYNNLLLFLEILIFNQQI